MRVLIAYDGSDSSKRALARAADLAGEGPVVVISAAAPLHGAGRGFGLDPVDPIDDHRALVAEAEASLAGRGVPVETIVAVGHPADAIVTAAEQGNFDLVVIGSRGLNAIERFLVGSTSTRVVAHAPCDVLVVR